MPTVPPPDLIRIAMFTPLPLCRKKGLNALLDGLEAEEKFGPTHWGENERARTVYLRAEMLAVAGKYPPGYFMPGIARRKSVKYAGYLDADSGPVQSVKLHFESELDTQLQQIFELGSTLAGRLKPLFGTVQPIWRGKGQEDNVADRMDTDEFREFGPRSICARTFLGPTLVALIGRNRLDQCGAIITDTAWGWHRGQFARGTVESRH